MKEDGPFSPNDTEGNIDTARSSAISCTILLHVYEITNFLILPKKTLHILLPPPARCAHLDSASVLWREEVICNAE